MANDNRLDVKALEAELEQVKEIKRHQELNLAETRIERDALKARLDVAVDALHKIDEPMKYHHWEEDAYTRAACFQFVAQEALAKIEEMGK